jgi:hypothetical protein
MTFELTSERLQEIAIGCVTQFIQKQASLSDAIAKEAMDLELNSDQTKRVIEATNTIAYLRQLEKSADRTFEFEVADFNKVMATMCMPDDMLKSAGTPPWLDKDKDGKEDDKEDDKGEKKDPKDKDDKKEKNFKGEDFGKDKKESKGKDEDKDDKKESKGKDEDEDSEEEEQEKKAMLMKGYFQAKNTLEKMAYDEAGLYMELVKAAGVVAKEPNALEKIAFVIEANDFDKAVKLCGIEKRAQDDLVFTDRELVSVHTLGGILKKAQAFVQHKAEMEDFVKRAEQLLFKSAADLEKQAFLGKLIAKGVGALAHGVGSTIGAAATGIGRAGANAVGNIGSFGRAASKQGFKSTDDAVKAYDKIKRTQGAGAAQAKFQGKKPSLLVNRIGLGGVLTATTGLSMDHKNNVKDL